MTCTHFDTLLFPEINTTKNAKLPILLSQYHFSFLHDFQLLYLYELLKQFLFCGAFSPHFVLQDSKSKQIPWR